jgi:hypothetical protein
MRQSQKWTIGSQIVYREVWKNRVWTARPVTVIDDSPALVALSFAAGTRWKRPASIGAPSDLLTRLQTGKWQLEDAIWPWDSVVLVHPSEAHAVHVMRGDNREFVGRLGELVSST